MSRLVNRLVSRRGLVSVLVLAGLVWLPVRSEPSLADPDRPVRILIVGDSMTQGSAGDYTWRYRLWKSLEASGTDVDFVGPRDDLYDDVTGRFDSHAYVDPAFDSDHAARWGRSMTVVQTDQGDVPIDDLVRRYRPDVVIEMLGVNDLQFLHESPADLEGVLRRFIADARAADPDVDLVLARIPQPWLEEVPPFNARVDAVAAELSTSRSRIVSAQSDAGLVRAEDTWESFHPNARGEVKIAAAVQDALSALGVGPPADRPLADVTPGPRIRPVLAATPTVRGLHAEWLRSPGAQESEVLVRDVTTGEDWHQVAAHLQETGYDLGGLAGWHRYEVQVVPTKWDWRAQEDAWSNVVDVEVEDDHLDRPAAAVTATADGAAAVSWAAVPGATSYDVEWRPADGTGDWQGLVEVPAASAAVTGLTGRTAYGFRVRAARPGLVGDWSDESYATVPSLAAVARAGVARSGHRLRATASPVPYATSYTLWAAAASSCRRPPEERAFHAIAAGLVIPEKRFRLDAPAVWVRWVAVRDSVAGDLALSSMACVRLSR